LAIADLGYSGPTPLFAALADQLYSTVDSCQRSAMDIRLQLTQFIRSDSNLCSKIEAGLKNNETLAQYLDKMDQSGTWGDGNMIAAASLCYKRSIEVYMQNQAQPTVIDNPDAHSAETLVLGYVSYKPSESENHYVSLRRDAGIPGNKATDSCSPSPLHLSGNYR